MPIFRHRSPSRSQDRSRKHRARHEMLQNKLELDTATRICNADITVPEQRYRYYGADILAPEAITVARLDSEAWDLCRYYSANISALESVTVSVTVSESQDRCRNLGIGVCHSHGTGLGNTQPDMKCSRTN